MQNFNKIKGNYQLIAENILMLLGWAIPFVVSLPLLDVLFTNL
jgi:hypothetical protein